MTNGRPIPVAEAIEALTKALRSIEERADGLVEDGLFRAQIIREIARAALDAVDAAPSRLYAEADWLPVPLHGSNRAIEAPAELRNALLTENRDGRRRWISLQFEDVKDLHAVADWLRVLRLRMSPRSDEAKP